MSKCQEARARMSFNFPSFHVNRRTMTTTTKPWHHSSSMDPNDIAKCALHHYHHVLIQRKASIRRRMDHFCRHCRLLPLITSWRWFPVPRAPNVPHWVQTDGSLRDTHAEVLCRRGLLQVLLQEVATQNLRLLEPSTEKIPTNSVPTRPCTCMSAQVPVAMLPFIQPKGGNEVYRCQD